MWPAPGSADGVLVVDETGFLKKGTKSAGVQRQYSGTAGRIENCQLGVFCAYATRKGRALIDRELYLPKSWIADRDRCREAAVPDDVEFATKTDLARAMLGRALDAGVPAAWVTADEAYGKDCKFRSWLEQRRIGYVVAVACNQVIPGSTGTSRADVLAAHAPEQAWKRRSCGEGAKGPRLFGWAVASLPCYEDTTPPGWSRWLLVRRSLTRNAKGEHELAYYLCCAPAGTTDEELIRVAGPAGRSRNASRPPRTRPAWTTTRSAATTPGTGTSPWPCSPTPTSPSRRRSPQKPWQRPHPVHARRGPPSPGTPDHHRPRPRRRLGLVPLAPPPPAPRQNQPLPAKTSEIQRSAAGVLVLQWHLGECIAVAPVVADPGLVLASAAVMPDQDQTRSGSGAGALD